MKTGIISRRSGAVKSKNIFPLILFSLKLVTTTSDTSVSLPIRSHSSSTLSRSTSVLAVLDLQTAFDENNFFTQNSRCQLVGGFYKQARALTKSLSTLECAFDEPIRIECAMSQFASRIDFDLHGFTTRDVIAKFCTCQFTDG